MKARRLPREDIVFDVGAANSRKQAIKRFREREEKLIVEEERAVKCMKNNLFNYLRHYAFDKKLWTPTQTTNILERAFREVRRRTRPMNNFLANESSAHRIMYGISEMLNRIVSWTTRPLHGISL